MNDFIKRNWINVLGGLFLFTAFLYFFELAIEEGWFPPAARVAIGLITGLTGLFYGYTKFRKQANLSAELLAGLGNAIVYATFAYASFSSTIQWSTNTVFISMISFTSLVTFVSYKYDMRKLGFISLLGGLITPLILKASEAQVSVLFIYVFILNVVSLYLSASKKWPELSVMTFLVTAAIYMTYYLYFDPVNWQQPTYYAGSFFVVYFIGLLLPGIFDKNNFNGLNLYLGLLNAINFIFWSIYIFSSFSVPYALPTLFVGLVFMLAATIIYKRAGSVILPALAYYLLSIVLIAVAGSDLAGVVDHVGMQYVISTSVWGFLILVVYVSGHLSGNALAKDLSMIAWVVVLAYWYSVAWEVEWVRWFGVTFVPFINPGALVWIALAMMGFTFSRQVLISGDEDKNAISTNNKELVSLALGIISHIVVGGLLTIQIENLWSAYQMSFIRVEIMLSISWIVYALGLFWWGAVADQKAFRYMGSFVLIITAIKVFAFDLSGASTIYLVLFLFVIGLITLLIARIDSYWRKKHDTTKDFPAEEITVVSDVD